MSSRRVLGRASIASLALGAIVAVMVTRRRVASADESPGDGVPSGALGYFARGEGCPMGWEPATQAQGRFAVGTVDPAGVGRTVGTPLQNREDRTHTHSASGAVTLAPRAIAAADGSNNSGARAGMYPVMVTSGPASSGLGYVQLRPCVKR